MRNFEVIEFAGDGHIREHGTSAEREFPSGVSRGVDDRLESSDIGGEERDEDATVGIFDAGLNIIENVEFAGNLRIIDFDVCGIAHEEAHTFIAESFETGEVCFGASHGCIVDAPVSGVDNFSDWGIESESVASWNGVTDVDEFGVDIAKLKVCFGAHNIEIDVF